MRASHLLLSLLLLTTGCASVSLAPGPGGALSLASRVSRESRPKTFRRELPPRATAPSFDEEGRKRRRRVFREGPAKAESNSSGNKVASDAGVVDTWEALLASAGLEEHDARPVVGSPLTPTHAGRLLNVLLGKDVTLGQFPARVAVGFMLREVLDTGEVSQAELVRRVGRFTHVAVLRPDGYLAWVPSGRTQQKVEPVEWKDGAFRAHGFELGRFYDGSTGVFRLLDAELREANGFPIADVHDDADVVSRGLDGAEEAFVGLALAVGKFFSTSPAENLDALRQMPAAVVALIESSPEYLERFKYMTRGEQIQAVSKMVTNLIATWGTASAATRTFQGTALATVEVPALSLSVNGMARMSLVAVPVGRAAAVLSGGPVAAIILQRVGEGADSGSTPPSGLTGAKSYSSFKSFKRAMGPAGPGKEWHHIVEQTDGNVGRFGSKAIHNEKNIVALDKDLHTRVSAFYSSIQYRVTGSRTMTVRDWMRSQSFEAQRDFGLRALDNVRKGAW
ncbi:hypothetical protein [Myxococcus landrumensis]|uniref:hypothetical protein n=1 Tax=Myxococcus landrumensis TaxID=2813577 RepID=UPI001F50CF4A|nr:hypothetical protein [Myxococcus landrumus]